ncbi:MAG: globin [Sphingobium sp.]
MDAPVTPFQMLGGAEVVASIVDRFYDLMDEDPAYADVRALHAGDLTKIRSGLKEFLNAWLGGPRDWFDRGVCMMSLHGKLPIAREVARQWADAMQRAIMERNDIDPQLAEAMAERLDQMAMSMVNRGEKGKEAA